MLDSKIVFHKSRRRRITDLFISLNLDNENAVALLDEEVGAEFAALWVFAFLPGIFDSVEAHGRILQPRIYKRCVVALAEHTHEPALGYSICNDQVSRCLEVTAVANQPPASPEITIYEGLG